jgi:hypothetical protein
MTPMATSISGLVPDKILGATDLCPEVQRITSPGEVEDWSSAEHEDLGQDVTAKKKFPVCVFFF